MVPVLDELCSEHCRRNVAWCQVELYQWKKSLLPRHCCFSSSWPGRSDAR
jgi:hypothetical protein